MASRATRGVTDEHQSSSKQAIAQDALLAVVLARVFDFHSDIRKYVLSVGEIQSAFGKGFVALGWVEVTSMRLLPFGCCRYKNQGGKALFLRRLRENVVFWQTCCRISEQDLVTLMYFLSTIPSIRHWL